MNKFYAVILLACLSFSQINAQTTTHSFDFDNVSRDYILHVPAIYDGNSAVPLLISLHGLGDNMNNFSGVGFHQLSESENFIVVTPEALNFSYLSFPIGTSWNSGVGAEISILSSPIYPNETIDDVGFISAIIDSLSASYNIDADRIYATGFSMGGFMTNRLAVELNDRIAAIASVSGTLGDNVSRTNATPIPAMHIHGTADLTIDYNADYQSAGGLYTIVGDSVNGLMNFWNGINQTDATPTHDPNYATVNGLTVEHFRWANGIDSTEVQLYKVNGGEHTWYGPFYQNEIWDFLSTHKNKEINTSITKIDDTYSINIFPNPTNDIIYIDTDLELERIAIYNVQGELVLNTQNKAINLQELTTGMYFIQLQGEGQVYSGKIQKK